MSRADLLQKISLLEEQERRFAGIRHRKTFDMLYPWQLEFSAATNEYHECCLIAANQIGKTLLGTEMDALHLLGDYPDGYEGYRFDHAPMCWALGYSMEKTRDLLQTALFGDFVNGAFVGGLVPIDKIVPKGWESATGTPNAMRTVQVLHSSGERSKVQFWSYSQGQHAIMGDVVDWFHVDEEPKDQNIRPQVLTRTANGDNGKGGRGIYTFTPENGRTDLVIKFLDEPSRDQFCMTKGWDDAPHMDADKQERMLEQYPEHQRDMRTKGIPMLGHGRIYDLADEFVTCEPFEIPDHWFVIDGMDFGYDHPQAQVQLVENRDTGDIYITKAWKKRKASANDAWGATKLWSEHVPTAWPHDGLQHEKGRDVTSQQRDHYADAGFYLLKDHATWDDGGLSVESGLYLIHDLMSKGKFKVFRGVHEFFEEFRQYHRDEKGRIVKANDDVLDAVRYAYMMLRYAIRFGDIGKRGARPRVKRSLGR
jgi:phage terminase large subunit-like protein